MHEHDVEYCDFRELTALVMTWNVGASTPQSLRYDENNRTFLKDLLRNQTPPELLIFAFQELVDLEDKKVTASKREFFIWVAHAKIQQRASSKAARRRTRLIRSI